MKLPLPQVTIAQAEAAGYDCGCNGANEANCHYQYFASPEHTRAWEHGKRLGEKKKQP